MQERLQKLIAQAGIASRRASEALITAGEVSVNGEIVTELGTKADPEKDHIKVKGKLINSKLENRSNIYILLNKPKGYLSSAADPEGRKLVVDLVKGHGRLHPVGRLDYNTEGLIILTNDGDFTNYVASSKTIPKVYEVKVKGLPTTVAINKLRRGVVLEDGYKTAPAEIKDLKPTDKNGWYEVTLHEGHNQQIRKMFDTIAHSVVKLKRIAIGSISDPYLKVGESRTLTPQEVADLGKAVPIKRRAPIVKPPRGSSPSPRDTEFHSNKSADRKSRPKRGARPSGKGPGRP
ncbi:pseudouridine synthase [soil metagenome]